MFRIFTPKDRCIIAIVRTNFVLVTKYWIVCISFFLQYIPEYICEARQAISRAALASKYLYLAAARLAKSIFDEPINDHHCREFFSITERMRANKRQTRSAMARNI